MIHTSKDIYSSRRKRLAWSLCLILMRLVLIFNQRFGIETSYFNLRGTSTANAYANANGHECPNEIGFTWKYSDSGFKDAGEGLKVECKIIGKCPTLE